jgi:hypothetical protein
MRDGTIALVSWLGSPEGTPVESPDGLARLIDEMETAAMAERPLAMHIVRADGDCLTLGVSEEGAVLLWQEASGEPPYRESVGEQAPGMEINFFDGQEGPWADSRNLVPVGSARIVAIRFVEGGGLAPKFGGTMSSLAVARS